MKIRERFQRLYGRTAGVDGDQFIHFRKRAEIVDLGVLDVEQLEHRAAFDRRQARDRIVLHIEFNQEFLILQRFQVVNTLIVDGEPLKPNE